MKKAIIIKDKELPLEALAHATCDIIVGREGRVLYSSTNVIREIKKKMDNKREFYSMDLFPEAERRAVESILGNLSNCSVIQNNGNGRYKLNETVYVKSGEFDKSFK